MGESDGVPCEPGTVIINEDGQMWICEGGKYNLSVPGEPMDIPDCPPSSLLAYNSQLNILECIQYTLDGTPAVPKTHSVDPLWIVLWMAVVFTLGALVMGLTQWWRNRKQRKAAEKAAAEDYSSFLGTFVSPGSKAETPSEMKVFTAGISEPTIVPLAKEPVMADPVDKNPDTLQDEIKEIYMQIQLGRGEINKIPGFVQICVNSAMQHLNKARDMVAALGGKVK